MPVPASKPQSNPLHPAGFDPAALMREPEVVAGGISDQRLGLKPNSPFLLRHYPSEWEVAEEGMDGPTVLPVITRQSLAPGVDGVRTVRAGERASEAYKNAVRDAMDRGWVYVPMAGDVAEHFPASVQAGSYMKEIPCQCPRTGQLGTHYAECWDVPARTVPGKPQRFLRDRVAYNRWRAWLVTEGLVPDIEPQVLEDLQRKAGARLRRAKTARHITPEIHEEIVAERVAEVKVAEAAVSPLDLRRKSRADLDKMARAAGVVDPEKLANKAAVLAALDAANG